MEEKELMEQGGEPRLPSELGEIPGSLIAMNPPPQEMPPVEVETVKRAMGGDREAFTTLFYQTYRYVYILTAAVLTSDEDRYDAVQETYTHIWASIARLRAPEAFLSWLRTIAHNCAVSIQRKNAQKASPASEEMAGDGEFLHDGFERETALDVQEVLSALPEEQAKLLVLVYYDGMKLSEIARMWGVPASTVRSRFHAAKKALTAALSGRGIDRVAYGRGGLMSALATAMRDAVGTSVLSAAVAQDILDSVLNKKKPTPLDKVVAKVSRRQRNAAVLRIATLVVLLSLAVSLGTALLLYGRGALPAVETGAAGTGDTTTVSASQTTSPPQAEGTPETMETGKEGAILPGDATTPPGDATTPPGDTTTPPGDTTTLSQEATDAAQGGSSATEMTPIDTTRDTTRQPTSKVQTTTRSTQTAGSTVSPSSAAGTTTTTTTAPTTTTTAPTTTTTTPTTTTTQVASVFTVKEVDGGVYITGVRELADDGIYTVPAVIDGKAVVGIGDRAFYSLEVNEIVLPDTITYIGVEAFYCAQFIHIQLPSSLTTIADSAFLYCARLATLTIPDSVTSIGEAAFKGCSRLRSLTLPNGLKSIPDQMCKGCNSLTSIVIPASVTLIGSNAFLPCEQLADVYIRSTDIAIATYAFSNRYQRAVDLTIYAPAIADIATFMWDANYEEWNG